jgi:hypothetical protein
MLSDLSKQPETYSNFSKNEICRAWLLQTASGRVFGVENGLVAFLTAPSNTWELTSKGESELHVEVAPSTAKVVGDFILNNWGKPAAKSGKRVNVGFAGETQVNVRKYKRDSSRSNQQVHACRGCVC